MKPITDDELEQHYVDMLTEVYGTVSVCGLAYDAGRVLREIDPTAFRCGFNDWLDAEINEGTYHQDADGNVWDAAECDLCERCGEPSDCLDDCLVCPDCYAGGV